MHSVHNNKTWPACAGWQPCNPQNNPNRNALKRHHLLLHSSFKDLLTFHPSAYAPANFLRGPLDLVRFREQVAERRRDLSCKANVNS
jgi:hypothetical protein